MIESILYYGVFVLGILLVILFAIMLIFAILNVIKMVIDYIHDPNRNKDDWDDDGGYDE